MKINFPAIYSTVIAIGLLLALAVPAPIFANNFYGIKSLNPMVTGGEMTFYLPGGTQATVGEGQTNYHLTDHLYSTRLAVVGDSGLKVADYTPFGDSFVDTNTETTNNRYTSMTYESESATYDYHARAYDPTVTRFTAVDAIRQSISPYSYTENNPINFVDSTGLGKTGIWLLASFVEAIPDKDEDMPHLLQEMKNHSEIQSRILSERLDVGIFNLDSSHLGLGTDYGADHLTLSMFNNSLVNHYKQSAAADGLVEAEAFSRDLKNNLIKKGLSTEGITSIMLEDTALARSDFRSPGKLVDPVGVRLESGFENSFAERFAFFAKSEANFPNLKSVIASPYHMAVIPDPEYPNLLSLNFSHLNEPNNWFERKIGVREYYTGDFTKGFFKKPNSDTVFNVFSREKTGTPYVKETNELFIDAFLNQHKFHDPIFYDINPQTVKLGGQSRVKTPVGESFMRFAGRGFSQRFGVK